MNWKKVVCLIRVDMKSGRLIRGQRLTRYSGKRHRLFNYLLYSAAIAIGLVIGLLVGVFYNASSTVDASLQAQFYQGLQSLLLSLPTIVLIYSLVFTMLQQIQRSGVRFSYQVPYWLPVTWQEHTLASILANMLGFPLIAITGISSAILTVSLFVGQVSSAVAAVLAMLAAAFTASATTEVFRILQVRFIGAVYKSTGKAAVWVRFIGSMLFITVFYVIYFYLTSSGSITSIQTIASAQSAAWFVPFVWLGMTLYSLINGLLLQGIAFLVLSLLFIAGLFSLATMLNRRFGLYEPPAITISRGVYAPKTGFLGKLGFSTVEAALLRKDLKAFTRRRELMTMFIVPIIVIILPVMQSLNRQQNAIPTQLSSFMFGFISLFPVAIMAMSLGNLLIGEEGQNVWRIYASPVSAKNLVKSKYAFLVFFSLIVLPITGAVGFLIYQPSLRTLLALIAEAGFMVFALGALSLSNGIKGADFTETPRPRMIRTKWGFINLFTCFLAGIAILTPILPYALSVFAPGLISPFIDLYLAVVISAIIAAILTVVFYRVALKNAKELLTKAEM
ncbi:ABC-2 transporter permease [Candidatus Bathyarchaeota archaeon]|nr:ABC-2 transporter permease [Candidatus Bathyarchaeota archaeon]